MKRLALLLMVCAACKSDKKPAPAPVADNPPAIHRTAVTPPPSLPAPNEVEGSDRPSLADDSDEGSGRHHHHRHWGSGSDGRWGLDGSATPEQREAFLTQRAANIRTHLDSDGDGKLSYDELKNAPGRMHFENPEELDANHDGDISADELAAGMKARRDAWRAQREAQQGGGGDPGAAPTAPAAPADNSGQ